MKNFKKKLAFTAKDANGKEFNLCVKRPTNDQARELQKVYNKAYKEAVTENAILWAALSQVAKNQGIWSDEQEKKLEELQAKIKQNELKILAGGNAGLTKKAAYELALEIRRLRAEVNDLTAAKNNLGTNTAEGQARDTQFNHQVAMCTFYNDGPNEGKRFFKDVDEYIERGNEDVAVQAAKNLSFLMFNLDPNYEKAFPENKFLTKYGYADENGRLINKDKRLVDQDGRLINENGFYIDEQGNRVDRDGNRVDEDGNYIVEFAEFLPENV